MNRGSRAQIVMNYVLLSVFALIAVYPLVGIVLASLYPSGTQPNGFSLPPSLHPGNFVTAWTDGHFGTYFRSSVIVSAVVVLVSTVLSILGGYALGTMRFRGSRTLFYVFLLGMIIPFEAIVVPLYYEMRSLQLLDTYWALILPEISGSVAFGVFWMRAFFLSAPPSLMEAARIDGASSWQTLWHVLVPYGRPAILTLVVLTFAGSWNEFFLALVMTTKNEFLTAPAGLSAFSNRHTTNVPLLSAGSVIVALPVVVVYILTQREFIKGMLTGALKG
jgi:raffinose/stachyose/melibiose transport system permease protein